MECRIGDPHLKPIPTDERDSGDPPVRLQNSQEMTSQESATITMEVEAFTPPRLSVAPGTTVVWRNEDSESHQVTSVQLHEETASWQFRSRSLRPNDSVAYNFDDEGVYEYFCRLHGQDMCGTIEVGQPSLHHSLPCE